MVMEYGDGPKLEMLVSVGSERIEGRRMQLVEQIGRMPESRMLLMAGLLLADKTAGAHDQVRALEKRVQTLEAELADTRSKPAEEPRTVEVPVVPQELQDMLAELAARAEAVAAVAEEKLS